MLRHLKLFGFIAGVLIGGCKDDEPGLKCAKDWVATQICCTPSDGNGDESCEDACVSKCETDEDCSGEDVCQGGLCGPDDDCSL